MDGIRREREKRKILFSRRGDRDIYELNIHICIDIGEIDCIERIHREGELDIWFLKTDKTNPLWTAIKWLSEAE